MPQRTHYYYIGPDSSMIYIQNQEKFGYTGRSQIVLASFKDDESSSL